MRALLILFALTSQLSNVTTSGVTSSFSAPIINPPAPVRVVSQSLLPNASLCNGSPCTMSAGGTLRLHLADPTGAGNALILAVSMRPGTGVCAMVAGDITDDQSNTWVAGPHGANATDTESTYLFYALNIAANTTTITISNSHCGSGTTTGVQESVAEFNNVALTSAIDGSSCNSGNAGTAVTTGSFTPAVSGDLVWSYTLRSNSQPNIATSFTAGTGFRLLAADLLDGHAMQYQVQTNAGAINPAMTMGNSANWVSCGMALKPASPGSTTGTGIAAGVHVVGIFHETFQNAAPTTQALQIPCRGNLLVAQISGSRTWGITSITDSASNTWTHTSGGDASGQIQNSGNGNSGNEGNQTYYATNATCSGTLTVTVNWSSTSTGHGGIVLYDIANANASAYDAEGITTNNTCCYQSDAGLGSAVTSAPVITPVASSTVMLCSMPVEYNTVANATNVTGMLFDSSTYSGEVYSGPEPLDQNNGWAHVYLSGTAQRSVSWTQFYCASGCPGGSGGQTAAFRGYVARCNTWK